MYSAGGNVFSFRCKCRQKDLSTPRETYNREERPLTRKPRYLPDRPVYGPPLGPASIANGPINESGVIYLFGTVAARLGYVVMRIQAEFPDCEAFREVEQGG